SPLLASSSRIGAGHATGNVEGTEAAGISPLHSAALRTVRESGTRSASSEVPQPRRLGVRGNTRLGAEVPTGAALLKGSNPPSWCELRRGFLLSFMMVEHRPQAP